MESQIVKDIRELCLLLNGDISSGVPIHHCYDHRTGRPCCESREQSVEKVCIASVHALYGTQDPRPAESTWTNVLINQKKTLLRRLTHRLGIDCFTHYAEDVDLGPAPEGPMDEGTSDYWKYVFRCRAKKVKEYYESERNMYELVVFVAVLEAADGHLLYPMLGDPIKPKDEDRSKLDLLLDKDSLIGQFSQTMLDLLDTWDNGDPQRRPWALLDILHAPLGDPDFPFGQGARS